MVNPAPPECRDGLISLLRDALARPGGRVGLAGALVCLGLLGTIFWRNLWHFGYTWSTDENYSHGFLVPLLSLYFANESARRGPIPYRSGVRIAVLLLLLSLLGRMATIYIPVGAVSDGALLLGLAGICALFAGAAALRRFGFALAFLVFMIPLPIALYTAIAGPLQLLVSRVASDVLSATGLPVLCEGNLITLPGGQHMFVAEACSGMRQLTGFLALTTAVAYLSPRPLWYRLIVVASSVPIAMSANVIRVIVTGWIMHRLGPRYAMGAFHTVEGLLMMGLGLVILGAECWTLNRIIAGGPFSGFGLHPKKGPEFAG
ncbi:MAG: exosortase/archaeosortase family protein [Isosphaeraceae bacterium]|nr:exosortase/archaeosortase family protein [Isosphaeraceae bacterium]